MQRSENILLIWALTIAGIFLAVLYSPLGSQDLYHPRKYFSENQGVNFINAPIRQALNDICSLKGNISSLKSVRNSSRGNDNYSNQNSELNISVENIKHKKHYIKSTSESSVSKVQYNSSALVNINSQARAIHNPGAFESTKSNLANKNSGNSGGSCETTSFSSTNRNNKTSNNTSNSQNTTFSSVNLSSIDSTSLFASNFSAQKGNDLLDPGNGDRKSTRLNSSH